MKTSDLVALGVASANHARWVAVARATPRPPAPTPDRLAQIIARIVGEQPVPATERVSVADLDTAIAHALARGTSSLEEARMARVALSQVPPRTERRVSCVVCRLALERHPDYPDAPICTACADDIPASRQRLADRRAGYERTLARAQLQATMTVEALDESDASRWVQIVAARDDARQTRWLERVKTAIYTPSSTKVSDALRRCWNADEVAFWTKVGAEGEIRRVDVAEAHLKHVSEACEAFEKEVVRDARPV